MWSTEAKTWNINDEILCICFTLWFVCLFVCWVALIFVLSSYIPIPATTTKKPIGFRVGFIWCALKGTNKILIWVIVCKKLLGHQEQAEIQSTQCSVLIIYLVTHNAIATVLYILNMTLASSLDQAVSYVTDMRRPPTPTSEIESLFMVHRLLKEYLYLRHRWDSNMSISS